MKTQCADFRSYGGSGAVALAHGVVTIGPLIMRVARVCFVTIGRARALSRVLCSSGRRCKTRCSSLFAVHRPRLVRYRYTILYYIYTIYTYKCFVYWTIQTPAKGWPRCGFWQKQTTAHCTQHTPCSFACKSCT